MTISEPGARRPAVGLTRATRRASDLLLMARESERAGCIAEAIEQYESSIVQAERDGERAVLAEGLRRLGRVRHQSGEREIARRLCQDSHDIARGLGNEVLAGEALNTLGVMSLRE